MSYSPIHVSEAELANIDMLVEQALSSPVAVARREVPAVPDPAVAGCSSSTGQRRGAVKRRLSLASSASRRPATLVSQGPLTFNLFGRRQGPLDTAGQGCAHDDDGLDWAQSFADDVAELFRPDVDAATKRTRMAHDADVTASDMPAASSASDVVVVETHPASPDVEMLPASSAVVEVPPTTTYSPDVTAVVETSNVPASPTPDVTRLSCSSFTQIGSWSSLLASSLVRIPQHASTSGMHVVTSTQTSSVIEVTRPQYSAGHNHFLDDGQQNIMECDECYQEWMGDRRSSSATPPCGQRSASIEVHDLVSQSSVTREAEVSHFETVMSRLNEVLAAQRQSNATVVEQLTNALNRSNTSHMMVTRMVLDNFILEQREMNEVTHNSLTYLRDAYENTVNDNATIRGELFNVSQSHFEMRNFINASLTFLMTEHAARNGREEDEDE